MFEPKSTTALLLVDVQKAFDEPRWGPRNNPHAEGNIARLLTAWRKAGAPVVHVFHDSRTVGSSLHRDHAGNAPKPEAFPREGEPQFRKNVNSAFIGTPLETYLRSEGIEMLVVVGLTTNHCVSTTVRMASNLGFRTAIVSDATATFDRATVDGRIRPAQEVHDAALSDLNDEFAKVLETADLIASHPATDTSVAEA
jgi:nicotinamidase-related amidase